MSRDRAHTFSDSVNDLPDGWLRNRPAYFAGVVRGPDMNRTAAGVFETYEAAGEVVRELELLGISGEQVEVVSDAASDARGEGVVPKAEGNGEVKAGEDYTVVIVRPADDQGMEQAKNLMDRYGAKLFRWQISVDGTSLNGDSA